MVTRRSLALMIGWIAAVILFVIFDASYQAQEGAMVGTVGALIVLGFVVFYFYWLISTKNEINSAGAHIPHGILAFIPVVNFWWLYRYAQGFAHYILNSRTGGATFLFTMLLWFFPIGAMPIIQWKLNKYAQNERQEIFR